MDDLLQRVAMGNLSAKRVPFMIEIPVDPESAPFLVTGTKKFLWIEAVGRSHSPLAKMRGKVRSAIREGAFEEGVFVDILQEVARTGAERRWGNGFPFTTLGLNQAVAYVTLYGMEKLEVLCGSSLKGIQIPKGVTVTSVKWMPRGKAVVVPEDRSYLGLVGILDQSWTALVHNPSRGMAVLGDW